MVLPRRSEYVLSELRRCIPSVDKRRTDIHRLHAGSDGLGKGRWGWHDSVYKTNLSPRLSSRTHTAMRFQLSTLVSTLLLFTSVHAQTEYCPEGETQMCCQNLLPDFNVGYYCATPDQAFPCQGGSPALQAMCCKSYDLTPRGVSCQTMPSEVRRQTLIVKYLGTVYGKQLHSCDGLKLRKSRIDRYQNRHRLREWTDELWPCIPTAPSRRAYMSCVDHDEPSRLVETNIPRHSSKREG